MVADTTGRLSAFDVLDHDDLMVIARPPFPNALLIGSVDVVGPCLGRLLPYVRQPLRHCVHRVAAPTIRAMAGGTVVIWNVEQFDRGEQSQILDSLACRGGDVQIISIATDALFQRVQRNEFLAPLYYRLNTVRIDTASGRVGGLARDVD